MPELPQVTRALLLVAFTLWSLWEMLPEPDPTIRFTCSNAPTLAVTDSRSRPIPCGDTTAVTFGYLR
jgi:hypothetical protein